MMPFLVIEGGEGSGKDTQIELLKKRLDANYTVFTREPGGTCLGEKLRDILLNTHMQPEAELLMFLMARVELVRTIIQPALGQGKLVVSNRFALSTIAYQIYGRDALHLLPFLKPISQQVNSLVCPYYILLDVDPEIGLKRVEGRGDGKTVFDVERLEFHRRVRSGYLKHYNDNGRGRRLNANLPAERVAKQIATQMMHWKL